MKKGLDDLARLKGCDVKISEIDPLPLLFQRLISDYALMKFSPPLVNSRGFIKARRNCVEHKF